jgi:hypothetical protein
VVGVQDLLAGLSRIRATFVGDRLRASIIEPGKPWQRARTRRSLASFAVSICAAAVSECNVGFCATVRPRALTIACRSDADSWLGTVGRFEMLQGCGHQACRTYTARHDQSVFTPISFDAVVGRVFSAAPGKDENVRTSG